MDACDDPCMVVLSVFWLMSPGCLMVKLITLIAHNIIITLVTNLGIGKPSTKVTFLGS
jgi:hypothetical protein